MLKQKVKTKDMVESILRNLPETRNSDIALTIEIWRKYYPSLIKKGNTGQEGVWLKDIFDLPREDNIKRERAKLNALGKYYPTDWKVAKARGLKEDLWRVENGYPEKANTVRPTRVESYMDTQRDFQGNKLFS